MNAKIVAAVLPLVLNCTALAVAISPSTSDEKAVRVAVQHSFGGEVQRIAVSGDTAVAFGDFIIEGSRERTEFLLQRFAFGWQIVQVAAGGVLDSCDFRARSISVVSKKHLQAGVGKESRLGDAQCASADDSSRDFGPRSDVVAIRALEQSYRWTGVLPSVRVRGDYAIAVWYGAGGGGGHHAQELVDDYHVPVSVACAITPGASDEALCIKYRHRPRVQ